MIATKLVLVEGPPGSGKSTTAQMLAEAISASGTACQCFLEWSADNPIVIGDDLHLDEVVAFSIAREDEVLGQWRKFARAQLARDLVTVLESRFWQTSIMLMYAAGHPLEGALESSQRIMDAIQGLNPVLIYFQIEDAHAFILRTIDIKEKEWQRSGFESTWAEHVYKALEGQKWFTERGLCGLAGLVAFLEDWSRVTETLYDRLPFPKIKIQNPHLDWALAMRQIHRFLDLP
jgi:thymidylate kinase